MRNYGSDSVELNSIENILQYNNNTNVKKHKTSEPAFSLDLAKLQNGGAMLDDNSKPSAEIEAPRSDQVVQIVD